MFQSPKTLGGWHKRSSKLTVLSWVSPEVMIVRGIWKFLICSSSVSFFALDSKTGMYSVVALSF